MDADGPYTRCPGCGRKLYPEREETVRAVRLEVFDSMGEREVVEGMPAAFHPEHAPHGSPRWRILDD